MASKEGPRRNSSPDVLGQMFSDLPCAGPVFSVLKSQDNQLGLRHGCGQLGPSKPVLSSTRQKGRK